MYQKRVILRDFFEVPGKKIEKKLADNAEAVRILNRLQKTLDNRFKTLPYIGSLPQKIYICVPATNTVLYFFMT